MFTNSWLYTTETISEPVSNALCVCGIFPGEQERKDQLQRAACPAPHPPQIKVFMQAEEQQHMFLNRDLIKAAAADHSNPDTR